MVDSPYIHSGRTGGRGQFGKYYTSSWWISRLGVLILFLIWWQRNSLPSVGRYLVTLWDSTGPTVMERRVVFTDFGSQEHSSYADDTIQVL